MKKAICVILSFLILASCCGVSSMRASAGGEARVTVANAVGGVGDSVQVVVSIENNPGLIGLRLSLSYDSALLTLTGVTDGGLLGEGSMLAGDRYLSPYIISWEDAEAVSEHTGNGTLATLTFTVVSAPQSRSIPVAVSVSEACGLAYLEGGGVDPMNVTVRTIGTANGAVSIPQYSVSFNLNGADGTPPPSIAATRGLPYGALPAVAREGYDFAGWYTAENGGTRITAADIVVLNANAELFAHWTGAEYTVSFSANYQGASAMTETSEVVFAQSYDELPTPARRAGYVFDGWNTLADGTGTRITASSIVVTADDHTLYAEWADAPKLRLGMTGFKAAVGDTVSVPVVITENPGVIGLKLKLSYDTNALTLVGVTNGGVFTSQNSSAMTTSQTLGTRSYVMTWDSLAEEDITATGTLVTLRFTVNSRPDGGLAPITLLVASPEDCYDFDMIPVLCDVTNSGLSVVCESTVTFNAGAGAVSSASKTVTSTDVYGELPTPERTGYEFGGWHDAETLGNTVTAETVVTAESDHTLWAYWTAKRFSVSYDAGAGTVSPDGKMVSYDSTYGALPTPAFDDHVFFGWYTQPDGGGSLVEEDTVCRLSDDCTLYARWIKKASVSVAQVFGRVGDTVSVDISLADNPGVVCMALEISYNAEHLRLTSVTDGGLFGENNEVFGDDLTVSPYVLTWADELAPSDHTANGVLATLTFEIIAFPDDDTTPVRLNVTDFYDHELADMPFKATGGSVSLTPRLAGDVNGDGTVNLTDVTVLRRYVAEWVGVTIFSENADVTGDGKVDLRDVTLLRRYMAGWTGVTLI